MTNSRVRTRIAPSPTGIPHIGNTRTALFDYLLARKYGGDFVLRIEDTDQDRLFEGGIEAIYKIMSFLGINPDESPEVGGKYGPYIQTQRLDTYKKHIQELIEKGFAYYCFCDEERLKKLHEDNPFAKYDRHCRNLSKEEVEEKIKSGAPYVIRAKLPESGYTVWHDLVQGKISLPNNECDDKVLIKTNGIPTYHFAVVVDDHLMEITHMIRGVEWISSTPIHLFLYESFGWKPPIFAHVPLLLGPDKSKLSKRHGAKSVLEYAEDGYLPEALNNFLFYLGFSYKDNSNLLTLEEMAEIFDEKRIQKQNAIFDIQKLNWLNSQWIKKISDEDLFNRLKGFMPESWANQKEKIISIIKLTKDRLVTLKDFEESAKYFFDTPEVTQKDVLDQSGGDEKKTHLWFDTVLDILKNTEDFSPENLHEVLAQAQKNSNLTPREAFMSLRVAATGRTVTPPLFDCIVVLGREESLARIEKIFEKPTSE